MKKKREKEKGSVEKKTKRGKQKGVSDGLERSQ
jgi:hypothetical protein